MSTSQLFLLLSPLLLLVLVAGVVVTVALCQAKEEDVPAVLKESVAIFRRLADHLPHLNVRSAGPLQVNEAAGDAVGGAPPMDVGARVDETEAKERP
ncbi:hypothetical protein GCM10009554_46430 [Kribbella koreensis]|uniref:Uncharacterized protein n=1 Tax=Kribbella koreensis TaxID=57909 RepID=A0ABP4BB82_9ACTN